jgi:hypothetical protein
MYIFRSSELKKRIDSFVYLFNHLLIVHLTNARNIVFLTMSLFAVRKIKILMYFENEMLLFFSPQKWIIFVI